MTSEALRKLEDRGLVRQDTSDRDRRAKTVVVTPQGAQLAERAIAVVEKADAEFFSIPSTTLISDLHLLSNLDGDF